MCYLYSSKFLNKKLVSVFMAPSCDYNKSLVRWQINIPTKEKCIPKATAVERNKRSGENIRRLEFSSCSALRRELPSARRYVPCWHYAFAHHLIVGNKYLRMHFTVFGAQASVVLWPKIIILAAVISTSTGHASLNRVSEKGAWDEKRQKKRDS